MALKIVELFSIEKLISLRSDFMSCNFNEINMIFIYLEYKLIEKCDEGEIPVV